MAYTCDVHDGTHYADVLVSKLDTGDTMAVCGPAYLDLCRAMVDASVQAEVDATDAEALARLGVPDETTAFPTPQESSDADDPPGASHGDAPDEPTPTPRTRRQR